ncbi:hypothetical protein [Vibrio rotiferianus]|uniref:hypothetical protein n=1 Tax=Vibrio rotiferianus TaxID=190895 RepID=UPI0005EFA8B0|nr:hypothetical protein [Vibrio rotiferianus]
MSTLHIAYGYCENAHKARLFEHLVQNTPTLRVKTIGHIANKAVFAILTHSFKAPELEDVIWLNGSIPNKRKTVESSMTEFDLSTLSRNKCFKQDLTEVQINQLKKFRRTYRKQKNLMLTEKNWRQHINRKAAISEAERALIPQQKTSFFLSRGQQPTPYSCFKEKHKEQRCQKKKA